MIRRANCRNRLHFYRTPCRLSIIGRKKVYNILLHYDVVHEAHDISCTSMYRYDVFGNHAYL